MNLDERDRGRRCACCGKPVDPRSRVDKRWCDERCADRARRRRARGLPPNAYAEGGRRGRVPMGELTKGERLREELREEVELENVAEQLRRVAGDVERRDELARRLQER